MKTILRKKSNLKTKHINMFKRLFHYTRSVSLYILLFFANTASGQKLKPGFDPNEYLEMLRISAVTVGVEWNHGLPAPKEYHMVYKSNEMELLNKWDLWLNKDNSVMVISIRGTTKDISSWLENFYAAMIPATGSLKLSDSNTFNYKFSNDPKALVHVGWTVGLGTLMPTIITQVKKYYAQGVKQIIIMGHSQGAAMAFLLCSYLHYQIEDNHLPNDLTIKTYCSAAPKPGNLYYAYDFDYITRGGWAYTIVNAADWVPEVPFSIQTINDFNALNPFRNAKQALNKQGFFVALYGKHLFNNLNRPTMKAQKRFKKYLGNGLYKQVKKYMPQYQQPEYANSNNYMRAGVPIVLEPDAAYYKEFPDSSSNVFEHHLLKPYYTLVEKIYLKQ